MKKIDKQTLPADHAFRVFYNTHNAIYIEKGYDGRKMWKYCRANKDALTELQDTLLAEQGYICCYCGCRIDKEDRENGLSVEHFERKGEPKTEHLALEYTNLMACCKRSKPQKDKEKVSLQDLFQQKLKTLNEIANFWNVEASDIFKENGFLRKIDINTDLEQENAKQTLPYQIIIKPILLHCDDTKDVARNVDILNPTTTPNCEFLFTYTEINDNCKIDANNQLAENSKHHLNLNSKDLCRDRMKAYKRGFIFKNDFQQIIEELPDEEKIDFIDDIIQNDIYKRNDKAQFDEFCFVTAVVFRNSFLP